MYEHLGGLFGTHYGEDWIMWVRVAAHYSFAYTPLQLANYRVHDNSITSRYFQSGEHIKDTIKAINIIQNDLPADKKRRLKNMAKKTGQYILRELQIRFIIIIKIQNRQLYKHYML